MLNWLRRSRDAGSGMLPPRIVDLCGWPTGPIYAIGDIHGHADLLRRIEAMIEADRAGAACTVITLGDHVDKGPRSAEVLDRLIARPPGGIRRISLRGNHEEMMLDFLRAPGARHPWLQAGGMETLASYGIYPHMIGKGLSHRGWRQMLDAHLPAEHLAFLEGLPEAARSETEVFVHAWVDPAIPLEEQDRHDLLWRRARPSPGRQAPDRRVVHGHSPVARVEIGSARISADTGAGSGGALSAVVLHENFAPRVLSATDPGAV